jgi:hypothetical protein
MLLQPEFAIQSQERIYKVLCQMGIRLYRERQASYIGCGIKFAPRGEICRIIDGAVGND